jgi:tryptophan synthase alpha chain
VTRYSDLFHHLEQRREGAFVPFVVVGDPDPDTSLAVIRALASHGADALELGLPFSDPIADGPAIQAASTRALNRGVRLDHAWSILKAIRAEFPELPVGLLVYANLVLHRTAEKFYAAAADAGVDSVLVADAPLLEADRLRTVAQLHDIAPVLIAPPNADPEHLAEIAAESEAYVYVTSRPGVTGSDQQLRQDGRRVIQALRAAGSAPPLLGFGIAEPEHVRGALALGAAGAISGSAVVRRVAEHLNDRPGMLAAIGDFIRVMKAATQTTGAGTGADTKAGA